VSPFSALSAVKIGEKANHNHGAFLSIAISASTSTRGRTTAY
jgi:hypothetical protein